MLSLLKNYSILYAEDDLLIQKNIREYLESYFNRVHVASNGNEALSLYEKYHPDVLLLDINLPLCSGLSLAKQIREKDYDVKIVMLTAYSEREQLLLAMDLKLTKYLIKPFSPKLFKEMLEVLAQELKENSSQYIHMNENYVWDKRREILSKNDLTIFLSEKEHRLIKFLIAQKGKSVTYEEIMIKVWEDAFDREISINSVKNQMSHLRKKLPNGCIDSVYGKGYIFR